MLGNKNNNKNEKKNPHLNFLRRNRTTGLDSQTRDMKKAFVKVLSLMELKILSEKNFLSEKKFCPKNFVPEIFFEKLWSKKSLKIKRTLFNFCHYFHNWI